MQKVDAFVGVDLGIKDFAIISTGEKISNPKYLRKYEKKINSLATNVVSKAERRQPVEQG